MPGVTGRRLKVGVFVPTWTTGSGLPHWTTAGRDDLAPWAGVLATARAAEDAGLDSIWACDHMLMDEDWTAPDPPDLKAAGGASGCLDAWAVMAALAAAT